MKMEFFKKYWTPFMAASTANMPSRSMEGKTLGPKIYMISIGYSPDTGDSDDSEISMKAIRR